MRRLATASVLVLFFIFSQTAHAVTPINDDGNAASEEDLYQIVNTMMGTSFTSSAQLGPYEIECDDWWHEWNGHIAITVTYAGQDQALWWDDGTNTEFILSRSADEYDYTPVYFTVHTPTNDFYLKDVTGGNTWYSRDDLNSDGETHMVTYDMGNNTYVVAFEDLSGLGDGDYNDFAFTVTKAGPQCLCTDNDGDGYGNPAHPVCPNGSQLDCNDADSSVNPGATEIAYNGKDDDCNPATRDDDLDNDGYDHNTDCNDTNPAVHPGATEIIYNGIDDDCDTATLDDDLDSDGYDHDTDCNDNNPAVYPGAPEDCSDSLDNDCDGLTDCSDTADCPPGVGPCPPVCQDNDHDGYGNPGVSSCPNGSQTDCDDGNALINPGASEICNDVLDNDCDGLTDCADTVDCPPGVGPCPAACQDTDHDGYGNPGAASCANGSQTDCNDTDDSVHPGATEVPYNGKDDDCNPATLDDDLDGDGYPIATDCNDNDPLVHPGATEICNDGQDNDCDGDLNCDDSDCMGNPICLSCTDNDGDGYFVEGGTCGPADCNDNDPSVHPGATEICNDGQDNDCDGHLNCEDTDCAGEAMCGSTAVALAKTVGITIPGQKCFRVRIDNPGPYDAQISQAISWLQSVPQDVHTTLLNGNLTVPAGGSRVVSYPCFNVGAGAQPGDYSLDIVWTGTDTMGNPIQLNTDPTLHLYYPSALGASTGGVGGVGLPVNKLGLAASVLGPFMLVAGVALAIILWRKKRGSLKQADGL
jgi:hypothetical protein